MTDPVVVAGAGPAGLMLAGELALRKIPVVLVDGHESQRLEAPAMAVNAGTLEMLEQRGLAAELREGTVGYPHVRFADLMLDSSTVPGQTLMVLQSRLEKRLLDRAAELGAELRFGTEVTGYDADADGVTVRLRDGAGEHELRAAYLVGCDGRESVVRRTAGIAYEGDDWVIVRGIVGDVTIDRTEVDERLVGLSYTPNGDQFLGAPLHPGTMRVFTAEFSTDPPAYPDGPADLDQLAAATRRLTGAELRATGSTWLRHYSIVTRNAERYRDGRVFLAGDAAHVHYPYNGQGIGTAIGDAVNLGWKLAAAVRGEAPAGLLDSYHDERHRAGRMACMNIQAQLALLYPRPLARYMREMMTEFLGFADVNVFLAELVTNIGPAYPMGGTAAGAPDRLLGRRLPQVGLKTAAGDTATADHLHDGHAVLFDLSDGAARLPDVTPWSDRLVVVRGTTDTPLGATALFVRPDGHIAWHDGVDPDPAGLTAALRRWLGDGIGAGQASL
ncbi:FAD-dependent monooxygenase [Micromonospora sp. NPDC048898]|uniref:FAD-dependent monooxygenase n=1 Tax=Micromonospora sp. NPDC048898 TaxID=3364260 RepID=UPI00370FD910